MMKKGWLATLWAFLRLTRPLFLVGGAVLYLLGAASAVREGAHFNLLHLLSGQALVTGIQLMTHYTNEFFDQDTDRLNNNRTWFSGGSGVLVSGQLSPLAAQWAIYLLAGMSLLALGLAGWQVPLVLLPGVIALLAAWSYSGPPLQLASSGLGEAIASLIVTLLVPVVGYVMQAYQLGNVQLLATCLPLALIHFAMLIAFQIPDYAADEATDKRTLTVRLGPAGAIRLHNLSLFFAFCVILGLSFTHWPGIQLVWLALPLAIWQAISISFVRNGATRKFLWLTMGAVGLLALTSTLWLLGLLLDLARL